MAPGDSLIEGKLASAQKYSFLGPFHGGSHIQRRHTVKFEYVSGTN